jgi:hypothetical protein
LRPTPWLWTQSQETRLRWAIPCLSGKNRENCPLSASGAQLYLEKVWNIIGVRITSSTIGTGN